jgi:hypothetical protein
MFAFFDDSQFPKIYITFNSNINDNSWKQFTNKWLTYDKKKIPYTFIFNTNGLGISLIKYTQKIAGFIKGLIKRKQKNNDVFLFQSIIVCKNTYQRRLLEMVFYIQSPVSPVYIIDDENAVEQLYNNIIRHPEFYSSDVSAYFPK